MVDTIKRALNETPIGTVSIEIDGQKVSYDRAQALDELDRWEKRAARESGRRPRVATVDLSGF